MMNRVCSGIDSLDMAMEGGFPEKLNILIMGATGAGKTIFCSQFLANGAMRFNERGIFVMVDEKPQQLKSDLLSIGLDFEMLEKRKMIQIIDARKSCSRTDFILDFRHGSTSLFQEIIEAVHDLAARRLVLDSIDGFLGFFGNISDFKMFIIQLSDLLKELEVTSLLTTRFATVENIFSSYSDVELLCQGIIYLTFEEIGHDLKRFLRIRKMPGTCHSLRKRHFLIQEGGLCLKTG